MTTQVSSIRREFSVADEHQYDRRGPKRWVLSHVLRYKGYLVSFFTASILTAALFSAVPALIGLAFNEVLKPKPDPGQLAWITLLILGIVLARGVMDIINSFSVETLAQRLERDAREELYLSLLGKSQTFHNRQRVGDIMARATNDVRQLNPMINPGVALITESMLNIVMPLIFIAFIDPRLLAPPLIFLVSLSSCAAITRADSTRWPPRSAGASAISTPGSTRPSPALRWSSPPSQEAQEKRKFARNAAAVRDYYVKEGQVQARYLPLLFFGFAFTGGVCPGPLACAAGRDRHAASSSPIWG